VPAGQGVSYGYGYTTSKETNLILVPFGYAEGIPRVCAGAEVSVHGKRFKISGRVAMDQFVVDVGDLNVSIGDEVVIFGLGGPAVEELAAATGTINYEIVTRIGGRSQRVFL
jgi:alanine racemase